MRLIATTLLLVFIGSSCSAQTAGLDVAGKANSDVSQLSESSKTDLAIRKALDEPIDLNFDETPWSEVEKLLEKTLKINVVLTRSAMDDSLSANEPITCRLPGLPAKTAIRLMLQEKNATWLVQDTVVKIISLDDEEHPRFFTNHFINVRSLLARIAELEKVRLENTRPNELSAELMLIDLIQSSVSPDQWKVRGNGDATIFIVGGYAVVNCQDALADSLEDFLQDLNFHLSNR